LQPDTQIPDYTNPQAWNRYSYVLNNPIRYDDPTGHCAEPISGTACLIALGDLAILSGLAILAVGTVYLLVTPQEKVQRDIENIGPAIAHFQRNFHNNATAISDQITHLTAKKKDDIGFIEDLLRKHGLLNNKKARRALHDKEISRQGLTDEEIEAEIAEKAADIARRLKNKNKDKKSKPE
jgi:hypothetical protein